MWLDSDAIVLRDLNWLFDLLGDHDFVGFNDTGRLLPEEIDVRINCFLARRGSVVVSEWVAAQHALFPRTTFRWTEIGTELLGPICLRHRDRVKMLPFRMICPVPWDKVERFSDPARGARQLLKDVHIVMLSNKVLQTNNPAVARRSVEESARADDLAGAIVRQALKYRRPGRIRAQLTALTHRIFGGRPGQSPRETGASR